MSHMDKIHNKLCPNCNSIDLDIFAETSITLIYTCRNCSNSYGIKWLSEKDMQKLNKAKRKGQIRV